MSTVPRIERLIALLAVFVLTAAACGDAVQTEEEGDERAETTGFELSDEIQERVDDGEALTIRVSYHDPSLPFATPVKEGVADAAEEFGVDAKLIGPAGGSADSQVNELETLMQQQVDGLAISAASNDALVPVIDRAISDGIPVVSFNTNNPESKQLGFVGQELRESGQVEAEELLRLLGGKKGKVVLFSVDTGAGWSNDRVGGFMDVMDKQEGIEVVGAINTGNEPQQAFNAVENAMKANPDAIAIASVDCCSFVAAQKWVEQNKKQDQMVLIGHDVLPDTVEAIKKGIADVTLSQDPHRQGFDAVRVLVEFLRQGTPIPEHVNTGIVVVTKENIDDVPVEG